jgi:hypothetical protein
LNAGINGMSGNEPNYLSCSLKITKAAGGWLEKDEQQMY